MTYILQARHDPGDRLVFILASGTDVPPRELVDPAWAVAFIIEAAQDTRYDTKILGWAADCIRDCASTCISLDEEESAVTVCYPQAQQSSRLSLSTVLPEGYIADFAGSRAFAHATYARSSTTTSLRASYVQRDLITSPTHVGTAVYMYNRLWSEDDEYEQDCDEGIGVTTSDLDRFEEYGRNLGFDLDSVRSVWMVNEEDIATIKAAYPTPIHQQQFHQYKCRLPPPLRSGSQVWLMGPSETHKYLAQAMSKEWPTDDDMTAKLPTFHTRPPTSDELARHSMVNALASCRYEHLLRASLEFEEVPEESLVFTPAGQAFDIPWASKTKIWVSSNFSEAMLDALTEKGWRRPSMRVQHSRPTYLDFQLRNMKQVCTRAAFAEWLIQLFVAPRQQQPTSASIGAVGDTGRKRKRRDLKDGSATVFILDEELL